MRHLFMIMLMGIFTTGMANAQSSSCIADGKTAQGSAEHCKGGPLQAGDQRLKPGSTNQPQPAGRGNSFRIGDTDISISGSIRVDGVYSR